MKLYTLSVGFHEEIYVLTICNTIEKARDIMVQYIAENCDKTFQTEKGDREIKDCEAYIISETSDMLNNKLETYISFIFDQNSFFYYKLDNNDTPGSNMETLGKCKILNDVRYFTLNGKNNVLMPNSAKKLLINTYLNIDEFNLVYPNYEHKIVENYVYLLMKHGGYYDSERNYVLSVSHSLEEIKDTMIKVISSNPNYTNDKECTGTCYEISKMVLNKYNHAITKETYYGWCFDDGTYFYRHDDYQLHCDRFWGKDNTKQSDDYIVCEVKDGIKYLRPHSSDCLKIGKVLIPDPLIPNLLKVSE